MNKNRGFKIMALFLVLVMLFCSYRTEAASKDSDPESSKTSSEGSQTADSKIEKSESQSQSNKEESADTSLLLREEHYKDGILDGYYEYQHDPSGKMIRGDYYKETGELSGYTEYSYDDSGNCIEETSYTSESVVRQIVRSEYDENGNKVKELYPNIEDGSISSWDEYDYDEAGNPVERRGYRKGALSFTYHYRNDENGNKIYEDRFDENGQLTYYSEYGYDDEGHLLTYRSVRDGKEENRIYIWSDDFMTRTVDTYDSNGNPNGKYVNYYDEKGNEIQLDSINADGVVTNQWIYVYG